MSGARQIEVVVLSHEGNVLGTVRATPQAALWRAAWLNRGKPPRVWLAGKDRNCEPYEGGWAVRLEAGVPMPHNVKRSAA